MTAAPPFAPKEPCARRFRTRRTCPPSSQVLTCLLERTDGHFLSTLFNLLSAARASRTVVHIRTNAEREREASVLCAWQGLPCLPRTIMAIRHNEDDRDHK